MDSNFGYGGAYKPLCVGKLKLPVQIISQIMDFQAKSGYVFDTKDKSQSRNHSYWMNFSSSEGGGATFNPN
jgi:hypothetical protein